MSFDDEGPLCGDPRHHHASEARVEACRRRRANRDARERGCRLRVQVQVRHATPRQIEVRGIRVSVFYELAGAPVVLPKPHYRPPALRSVPRP